MDERIPKKSLKEFLRREKALWISALACALALGFNALAPAIPLFIEKAWIPYVFKPFNGVWSRLAGLLPFSLAEAALLVLVPAVLILLILSVVLSIVRRRARPFLVFGRAFLVAGFILLSFFTLSYSVNYKRAPLADALGYEMRAHPVADLVRLCETLAAKVNESAKSTLAGQNGVMLLSRDASWYYAEASKGYDAVAADITTLAGSFGRPKPVALSTPMCWAGIVGIYFPFTGEPNLNARTPLPDLLFAMEHEMAHQRGYAREDEANYIGYLVCVNHPDPEFVYAGYYEALIYATNALYGYSPDEFWRIRGLLDARPLADLAAMAAFWKQFEGPVEKAASKVNDAYLKTQQVYDGVYSYGRVVDLLLAGMEREGT